MTATELMWPEWVLRPANITPLHATPMNTSGGRPPTGGEQIIGNTPGRNRVVLQSIAIRTAEQERIWRTIALTLGGRAGTIMVPAFARRTAPWPTIAENPQISVSNIALTDDILFSDGSGLYARTILAQAASDVGPGAVTMQIKLLQGSSIKIGHIFQAGECAYTVTRIMSVDESSGYPVFDVKFRLPCRIAIATGDDLEFDNPRFRASLETDDGMSLDLEQMRFGNPSVAFVEDI